MIILGTDYVDNDEPCFALSEVNLQAPDSKGFRRYRIIRVIRGQRLADYKVDLGLAKNFSAEQFCIPGGWVGDDGKVYIEETVGSLKDWANRFRERKPMITEVPLTDILGTYQRELEMIGGRNAKHN